MLYEVITQNERRASRERAALVGASPSARVLSEPLPAEPSTLRAFYDEGVAAYLDGVVLVAADDLPARYFDRGALRLQALAGRFRSTGLRRLAGLLYLP